MPGAPSSFLFLVVRPGAPSSVLAPSILKKHQETSSLYFLSFLRSFESLETCLVCVPLPTVSNSRKKDDHHVWERLMLLDVAGYGIYPRHAQLTLKVLEPPRAAFMQPTSLGFEQRRRSCEVGPAECECERCFF